MKIRSGFVANSSSSSFVAFIPESIVKEKLSTSTPFMKAIVEANMEKSWNKKVAGIPFCAFYMYEGSEDVPEADYPKDCPALIDGESYTSEYIEYLEDEGEEVSTYDLAFAALKTFIDSIPEEEYLLMKQEM